MIFKLNIQKTYGQISEDISKKNKYNKITIPIYSYTKNDSSADYSEDSIINNKETGRDFALETNFIKFTWDSGLKKCYRFIVPRVKYMEKIIELDTNTDEYSALSTIQDVPQYETSWEGKYNIEKYSTPAFSRTFYNPFGDKNATLEEVKQFILNNDFELNVFPHDSKATTTQSIVNNSGEENTISSETAEQNIFEEYDYWKGKIYNGFFYAENYLDSASEEVVEKYNQVSSIINQTLQEYFENFYNIRITEFESIPSEHKCRFKVTVPKQVQLVSISVRNRGGYIVEDYTYIENDLDKFSITFKFGSYNSSTTERTYYTGSHEYIVDSSFVVSEGVNYANIPYSDYYAGDLYENYKNGKQEISIKYPVSEKYNNKNQQIFFIDSIGLVSKISEDYYTTDENGNKVLCADYESEDGTKYLGLIKSEYNISSNVQVGLNDFCYFVDNDDKPVYVYKNEDGTDSEEPRLFLVKNPTLEYSGILYNNISAIDMPDGKFLSITSDEQTTVIVTRISSEKSFAPLKTLNVNDVIWEGDVLQITRTSQTGYYNTMTINGTEYTDDTYTVIDNTDIVVDSALINYSFTKVSGTIGTITRTSSPIGNGSLGELSTGDILYVNDVITIQTDKDVGEYDIKNGIETDSSDTLIYGGIDKTIYVQGNVSIYVRQASYRWKEISGGFGPNQWQNINFNIGSSYSTNVSANGVKPRTDKSKDDYKKRYEIALKYHNDYGDFTTPIIYSEGIDEIDDFVFNGSGMIVALENSGESYVVNTAGFGVNVVIDCLQNDTITITNNSNSSGYATKCYFTEIQIASIYQYEYS